jgi:hypothetical protein
VKKFSGLNIETLVLVAVWGNPSIFQGCFKISELNSENQALFFFRCQSSHHGQNALLNHDFSASDYEFTHLYNELAVINLSVMDKEIVYALDILKYALHITLKEMSISRKQHFTSIDDVAMQALISKIRPILNKESALSEDDHIGFAVAMDFHPREELGRLAALALLGKLDNNEGKSH